MRLIRVHVKAKFYLFSFFVVELKIRSQQLNQIMKKHSESQFSQQIVLSDCFCDALGSCWRNTVEHWFGAKLKSSIIQDNLRKLTLWTWFKIRLVHIKSPQNSGLSSDNSFSTCNLLIKKRQYRTIRITIIGAPN